MRLLLLAVTSCFVQSSIQSSICSVITDPQACVNKTKVYVHTCTWCGTDEECHVVGSTANPCENGCCASKSSASACKYSDPKLIPSSCAPTPPTPPTSAPTSSQCAPCYSGSTHCAEGCVEAEVPTKGGKKELYCARGKTTIGVDQCQCTEDSTGCCVASEPTTHKPTTHKPTTHAPTTHKPTTHAPTHSPTPPTTPTHVPTKTPTTTPTTKQEEEGLSKDTIIYIALGGAAGLMLLVAVVCCICRKPRPSADNYRQVNN